VDNNCLAEPAWTIVERRELRFSPLALQSVIGWSLGAASVQGLPVTPPDGVKLLPQASRVDLIYGHGVAARSIPLKAEALGSLLIAYCIRVRIPLRRVARKEVRIGAQHVALVFHVEHTHAPAPEVAETSVVRHGLAREWR
jgi:hypothetical protein